MKSKGKLILFKLVGFNCITICLVMQTFQKWSKTFTLPRASIFKGMILISYQNNKILEKKGGNCGAASVGECNRVI